MLEVSVQDKTEIYPQYPPLSALPMQDRAKIYLGGFFPEVKGTVQRMLHELSEFEKTDGEDPPNIHFRHTDTVRSKFRRLVVACLESAMGRERLEQSGLLASLNTIPKRKYPIKQAEIAFARIMSRIKEWATQVGDVFVVPGFADAQTQRYMRKADTPDSELVQLVHSGLNETREISFSRHLPHAAHVRGMQAMEFFRSRPIATSPEPASRPQDVSAPQ